MRMVPNPNPTFILLILGISTFIFIMFLPAFLELKKPKDAGPRMIGDYNFSAIFPITNLEEKHGFDQALVKKIVDVIGALPNLEI
jgi:hypothetical protein